LKIQICHLYPDLLDLYGDRGNIMALSARSRWRGIETVVHNVSLGEPLDFQSLDILFIGGGSDREQNLLVQDLMKRENELKAAIEDGLVVLTICGGYQLLGQYYQTADETRIPGLGILDLWTVAGSKRLIGNVIVDCTEIPFLTPKLSTLVGFENHSGKTFLGEGVHPLGKVLHGNGNNGENGEEGVRYKNVFGTYLHGPLLPKNPHFADLLLGLALSRRGFSHPLSTLDDTLEEMAHQSVVQRILNAK
jgi:lipid II isoglutaminyl synthase (glutamine-hydrolysing)